MGAGGSGVGSGVAVAVAVAAGVGVGSGVGTGLTEGAGVLLFLPEIFEHPPIITAADRISAAAMMTVLCFITNVFKITPRTAVAEIILSLRTCVDKHSAAGNGVFSHFSARRLTNGCVSCIDK